MLALVSEVRMSAWHDSMGGLVIVDDLRFSYLLRAKGLSAKWLLYQRAALFLIIIAVLDALNRINICYGIRLVL